MGGQVRMCQRRALELSLEEIAIDYILIQIEYRGTIKDGASPGRYRLVDHLSVERHSRSVALRNGGEDALRPIEFLVRWRETVVHDKDLPGMDAELRTEAESTRAPGF